MIRNQMKYGYDYDLLQNQYSGSGLVAKKMKKVASKVERGGLLLDRVKDRFKLLYGILMKRLHIFEMCPLILAKNMKRGV